MNCSSFLHTELFDHDIFFCIIFKDFDTSCFSGKYVTGESIGSAYFTRLHELRNDSAQASRRLPASKQVETQNSMAKASNHGCESMSNDRNEGALNGGAGCESISNQ